MQDRFHSRREQLRTLTDSEAYSQHHKRAAPGSVGVEFGSPFSGMMALRFGKIEELSWHGRSCLCVWISSIREVRQDSLSQEWLFPPAPRDPRSRN